MDDTRSKRWDDVQIKFTTEKNVFRFYEKAGKLFVSPQDWIDSRGNLRLGRAICIDLSALIAAPEAMKHLLAILAAALDQLPPEDRQNMEKQEIRYVLGR